MTQTDRMEAKIDLLFGLVANQTMANEASLILQQIGGQIQAISGAIIEAQRAGQEDKVKELENQKNAMIEEAKNIEKQLQEFRATTGRIVNLYNQIFGPDADKRIQQIVESAKAQAQQTQEAVQPATEVNIQSKRS